MSPRPRIDKKLIGEVIVDELEYCESKGSKNARKITEKTESVHIEVWVDKHYMNRVQFGDENGRREGIDSLNIESLVTDSLTHLIHYSFKIKNFSFLNEVNKDERTLRVVLQKEIEHGLLNVAVGFHHIVNNKYELTVYTAMVADDFRISDGQYVVLINDRNSILYKMDNRKLKEIDSR